MPNNSSLSAVLTDDQATASNPASLFLRVTFGIIATVAVVSNSAMCMMLLRNRHMLRTPYNVLLFSLAVTDTITGLSLFVSPPFVIDHDTIPVPSGFAGEIFCRVFFNHLLYFTLGIVSVYTVTVLAFERWYAAARPTKYTTRCMSRRLCIFTCVGFVWTAAFVFNLPQVDETQLVKVVNGTGYKCEWKTSKLSTVARSSVAVIEFLGKFFIPVSLSWGTFIHLWIRTNHGPTLQTNNTPRGRSRIRLLRMCAFTAFILGVCWFPNQFYYLLFKFDITKPNTVIHHITVILCTANSFVNPWIYCTTNKTYRRKFISAFYFCHSNKICTNNDMAESRMEPTRASGPGASVTSPTPPVKPVVIEVDSVGGGLSTLTEQIEDDYDEDGTYDEAL